MEQSKDGTKTMKQKKDQDPLSAVVQSFLGNMANFVACPMILSMLYIVWATSSTD